MTARLRSSTPSATVPGNCTTPALSSWPVTVRCEQAVQQSEAADKSFTVINTEGPEPTQEVWDALFAKL